MSALPQRPNNRGASSDPPPPSLPPRPGQSRKPPSHVAPPPPESDSDDEGGPPPLPPHPRGSALDDDEPGEIYDDCSEKDDNEPGEIYDDFEEGTTPEEPPELPQRPKLPPASPECYDDISNASGPVVQHIPKKPGRNLPPLPSAVPDKVGVFDDVYEDPDARQSVTRRPPSPPTSSAFTTSLSPQSAVRQPSPGRKSPSRLADDRPLPPIPKVGSSSLPPLPSSLTAASATTPGRGASGPANSASIFPTAAARGNKSQWSAAGGSAESDDSGGSSGSSGGGGGGSAGSRDVKHTPYNMSSASPVVVPLKNRANKGPLPSLPPPAPLVGDPPISASQGQGFLPPPAPPFPAAFAPRNPSTNGVDGRDDGDMEEFPPSPASEENVYEVDEEGQSSTFSAPPIPPPKDSGPKTSKPAPQPRPNPTSKGIPTAGPQGINFAELLKKREGLKVVSEPPAEQPIVRHDPKEYSDTSSSFKDKFQKFEEKQGKPGLAPKPAVVPKKAVPAGSSNGSSAAPKPAPLSMQPKDKTDSPPAPDVMFIHKPNKDIIKDKSSNTLPSPVSSPPPTSKPVTKFEPPSPSLFEPEDIYDDAASADVLDRYDWYHGDLARLEGEKRVKAVNKDGAFLVRVSKKDLKYPYTLVVLNGGHVNNLRIRMRQDKKVALGDEKADELSFVDVVAMINHHKNHNVVLLGSNQAHVKLQYAAAKK